MGADGFELTQHLLAATSLRVDQIPCVALFARVQNAVAGSTWRVSHQLGNCVRQLGQAAHVTQLVEAAVSGIRQILRIRKSLVRWNADGGFYVGSIWITLDIEMRMWQHLAYRPQLTNEPRWLSDRRPSIRPQALKIPVMFLRLWPSRCSSIHSTSDGHK